jgi:hypothetical protein
VAQELDLNNLNGPQRLILQNAILAAFTKAQLDMALIHNNREALANLVPEAPYEEQVFALIDHALRAAWCDSLVAILTDARPKNRHVQALLSQLESAKTPSVVDPPTSPEAKLERAGEGLLLQAASLREAQSDSILLREGYSKNFASKWNLAIKLVAGTIVVVLGIALAQLSESDTLGEVAGIALFVAGLLYLYFALLLELSNLHRT